MKFSIKDVFRNGEENRRKLRICWLISCFFIYFLCSGNTSISSSKYNVAEVKISKQKLTIIFFKLPNDISRDFIDMSSDYEYELSVVQ